MVTRQASLERIYNADVGRSYAGSGFGIWYRGPEGSDTDEYHHLDIRSGGRKVFSVAWRTGESAEIVTFQAQPVGAIFSCITVELKS